MDTGGQYIKMCGGAKEIRFGHIFMGGDFFAWKYKKGMIENVDNDFYSPDIFSGNLREYGMSTDGSPMKNWIWLPRQDQLQGMVGYQLHWLIILFNKWVQNGKNFKYGVHSSMEQLWLAFVMKERFNKEWRDNDWTKCNG